jgi:hypothetical protein
MLCVFPKVFLIMVSLSGEISKTPVKREVLNIKLQNEIQDHEGCVKRKLGQCVKEVHLRPQTGQKLLMCGKIDEA